MTAWGMTHGGKGWCRANYPEGTDLQSAAFADSLLSHRPFKVVIDGETQLEAQTLIIATGAQARYLVPVTEQEFIC